MSADDANRDSEPSRFDKWASRHRDTIASLVRLGAALLLLLLYSLPLLFLAREIVESGGLKTRRSQLERFTETIVKEPADGSVLLQFLLGASVALTAVQPSRRSGFGLAFAGSLVLVAVVALLVALALALSSFLIWREADLRTSYSENADLMIQYTKAAAGDLVIALGAMLGLAAKGQG